MNGVIADFDDAKGLGRVLGDDGIDRFFHCTAITDGTRTIAVGTDVSFEIVAGRRGQWEAVAVTAT